MLPNDKHFNVRINPDDQEFQDSVKETIDVYTKQSNQKGKHDYEILKSKIVMKDKLPKYNLKSQITSSYYMSHGKVKSSRSNHSGNVKLVT